MAKKSKKNEDLPEGMSRRQAKLAARAAERAALEKDPRPFGGFAMEADLVALQEFVPAAYAKLPVQGIERTVYLATVLPGAGAALVRDAEHGGEAFVALQASSHSQNPGRDLAYALNWVKQAEPGETLGSTAADGSEPELRELLDTEATLEITEADDFNWWMPEGITLDPQVQASLQAANDAVVPSRRVATDVPGSLWWVNPGGGKAHIRWVRPDTEENSLLNALARVAARQELNLGEGTKFAGVFRTHGVIVPVFDLDPERAADTYGDELKRVNEAIAAELDNDAQLSSDEHKQLQNIKSRQVTIR
ncbi:hypothetical protein COCCU_13315 [Corynebacterium occultum]|uniref:DUF5926 domain-containing protein n=1 Tax=Corynebacterium occultum TaxID=2675219 RepID=A0A6B8VSJ2_9CORY|nr:DUF5926 family protein [Corynebacterium occultum]QGU08562.1 hypothetical protein COCCU_13315 [Corynebacterium occultum]